jgi:hypothetical protein
MALGLKTGFLLTALGLLLVANFIMLMYSPYGPEGFVVAMKKQEGFADKEKQRILDSMKPPAELEGFQGRDREKERILAEMKPPADLLGFRNKEGFTSYFLQNAGGTKDQYNAMGPYDNIMLPTGNNVSQWRYTAPNEPLVGPAFNPGPDQLFMFKSNQCKPECCGASFSCSGGCVCTTPEQRQMIASRGGNRTQPEDSA